MRLSVWWLSSRPWSIATKLKNKPDDQSANWQITEVEIAEFGMTDALFENRYRIIRQIGAGGMGVVWEAEDQLLRKTVAIKSVRSGILCAESIVRFQREASALAALRHKNLVPIYIYGISEDNEPYMVMQFEQGKSLAQLIEDRGSVALLKSLGIFIQICDAMAHAHRHGVLHRDLKPGNIILRHSESSNTEPVIIDFGIAMIESNDAMDSLTKTGMIMGTPAYMSPEQIRGVGVDSRADIYAVGCMMFETLTGRRPFIAGSILEVLRRKLNEAAPSINSVLSSQRFPLSIEEIVSRALAMNADDRYQSMEQLKHDLIAASTGEYRTQSGAQKSNESIKLEFLQKKTPESSGSTIKVLIAAFSIAVLLGLFSFGIVQIVSQTSNPGSTTASKKEESNEMRYPEPGEAIEVAHTGIKSTEGSNEELPLPQGVNDRDARMKFKYAGQSIRKIIADTTRISGECFDTCPMPIEEIVINDSQLSAVGIRTISQLPKLRYLTLKNETRFKDGLKYLAEAPNLQRLTVHRCVFDGLSLETLLKNKTLRVLNLQGNKQSIWSPKTMGYRELKALSSSRSKTLFEMSWNEMRTPKGSLKLLKNLSGLKVLHLRNSDLSDSSLKDLNGLPLEELDLEGNSQITCDGLKHLLLMPSLKKLRSPQFTKEELLKHNIPASFCRKCVLKD